MHTLSSGYTATEYHSTEEPGRLLSYDVEFAEGCTLWVSCGAGCDVFGLVLEGHSNELTPEELSALVTTLRRPEAAQLARALHALGDGVQLTIADVPASAATFGHLVEFCRTDAAAELLGAWRQRRAVLR